MPKTALTCTVCGRKFGMPAHLGRHMKSMHGQRSRPLGRGKGRRFAPAAIGGPAMSRLTNEIRAHRDELATERAALDAQLAALDSVLNSLGG